MKVKQFYNKNQFIINNKSKIYFQSYETMICYYDTNNNRLYLNLKFWDWSNTTRKHFELFINENTPFTYENKKQWEKTIKEHLKKDIMIYQF